MLRLSSNSYDTIRKEIAHMFPQPQTLTVTPPARPVHPQLLPKTIHSTLKEVFGFDSFRPGQEPVIRELLAGHSALAVFPTGSGKSLCFQLSALHLDGLTIVVSPLIALMKDQIDFLTARNIPAARLDSSVGLDEVRRIDAELQSGTLKLLYVAPERFSNERFLHKLQRARIDLMVIDEAHCISEWGHNFRPDYLKLARLSRALRVPRVLALTATATPAVAADICREFGIAREAFVHTGFYRPNLFLRINPAKPGEQLALLMCRLRERPRGPAIVYVTLQRTATEVADALAHNRFRARAYHAGMDDDERTAVQDWFMSSQDGIVVATIAFGMGIDKADIRSVYHYNLPKSLENYSQEIGRAGRDGKEAVCEMFASPDDAIVLENFSHADMPDPGSIAAIVAMILQSKAEFDLSTYEISRAYDVRPLVVTTLLTYLELADVIEATAPFYSEYQFEPLKSMNDMIARFDAERAAFLKQVLAHAFKAQRWYRIDLQKTAERLQTTRERLARMFTYLEESGDLTLKAGGLRLGYRIKNSAIDPTTLTRMLVEKFETRERNDVGRVRQVLTLGAQTGCFVRHLLHYFGEDLGRNCGHCGRCLGEQSAPVAPVTAPPPPVINRGKLETLRRKFRDALATPRQTARFLCGLTSPRLLQNKLNKDPMFGSCADAPFQSVMEAISAMPPLSAQ
jgi:ATP-dependent DNA helicase RecQ